MYDRFGEFDSAEEINATAVNLRKEGDIESIKVLAKENGIDEDIVEVFVDGTLLFLCDDSAAALGKIEVEKVHNKCTELMEDWCEYIKDMCFKDEEFARAVRSKNKNLAGCIVELMKYGFKHQTELSSEIKKAAGVTAGRVTFGIPGMATAKKIIREYYLGK